MQYTLEVDGDTATLCVAGTLNHGDGFTLFDACAGVCATTRTLRLDLRAIGSMSAEATGVVRALLRQWREHHRGDVRLSTTHLVATLTQLEGMPLEVSTHTTARGGARERAVHAK